MYVLTPPGFRCEYAVQAIGAGKHVFCEKPLAICVDDGAAIVEVAARHGTIAVTGFNQRYRTGYRRLHDTAQGGSLGRLHHSGASGSAPGALDHGRRGRGGERRQPARRDRIFVSLSQRLTQNSNIAPAPNGFRRRCTGYGEAVAFTLNRTIEGCDVGA